MDLMVPLRMPNVFVVLLVKLLFAGSPECVRETVDFTQWTHLHKKAHNVL